MEESTFSALTIAGSDSGGGAGIQADLKTFMAFGVLGTCAVTAVTAQNTLGISKVQLMTPDMVSAQINAVLSDIGAGAAKTGMLGSGDIIRAAASGIKSHCIANLVVDPVLSSTSGHSLLQKEAIDLYKSLLFPLSLIVTPNLDEAEILTGRKIESNNDLNEAARIILDCGPRWVLIKGGHRTFDGMDTVTDLLTDGHIFETIVNSRVRTTCTHGTGCTLSAAITAGLARGLDLSTAVQAAEKYLHKALKTATPVGGGYGPVNHSHGLDFF